MNLSVLSQAKVKFSESVTRTVSKDVTSGKSAGEATRIPRCNDATGIDIGKEKHLKCSDPNSNSTKGTHIVHERGNSFIYPISELGMLVLSLQHIC